jgi:2-dehydro-3-deoxygluconokinase
MPEFQEGMAATGRFVAFGEIMLRMSPPGRELLLQTPRLDVWVAGAEANVATALARLGHRTAMVSAVPDNPLGEAGVAALRSHGVDCSGILTLPGRMGVYYVVNGAGLRATEVFYDRAHSSFAEAPADVWDWDNVLRGVDRLHLSGITPALGPNGTAAALGAARAASERAIPISFDGNFRARLWQSWDSDPATVLAALARHVDILFCNHRDIALMLGSPFAGEGADRDRIAAEAAFAAFPKLALIASTTRQIDHVDSHRICARIDTRHRHVETEELLVPAIVDRIGAGDAFAAGVLHRLRSGGSIEQAAEAGLALTALKHSLPGDASLFAKRDLEAFSQGGADVRR